ncbi:MAG TPA: hypothetical protein PK071_04440 [Atopobiaceae bacterium]|nr:hypothetical protein [Atopobiaceae bacterium]
MAEFEDMTQAIIDVTKPAFEGIEDYTPRKWVRWGRRSPRDSSKIWATS